ncbi:hypothetical protein HDU87_008362 [Geranomyces variabilis]|uniref:UDP-N-acetylglucosamine transferase subunit ALG13 n=1 Tax=Geranomyces variabilis TaxID=109894 RepID=A0AAD5XM47_9FUNG|nr:hypothetical protein HDU87_008362 [Geranomyces variabilis]
MPAGNTSATRSSSTDRLSPEVAEPPSVDTLRAALAEERRLLEQSRVHVEQRIAQLETERLALLAKQLEAARNPPAPTRNVTSTAQTLGRFVNVCVRTDRQVKTMSAPPPTRGVFVTVGTTRFDALVNEVCTVEFLATLRSKGYTSLTLQHGNSPVSAFPTADIGGAPFPVIAYAFKPDLSQDIATAALVISHAGAGLILETLDAGKPLIVVVNRALMDDHQTELAVALAEKEVLVWTDADGLVQTVEQGGYDKLKAFGKADPSPLVAVLDQEAGFLE